MKVFLETYAIVPVLAEAVCNEAGVKVTKLGCVMNKRDLGNIYSDNQNVEIDVKNVVHEVDMAPIINDLTKEAERVMDDRAYHARRGGEPEEYE